MYILSSPFGNNYCINLKLVLFYITLLGLLISLILLMVSIATLVKSGYKSKYKQVTSKRINRPLLLILT